MYSMVSFSEIEYQVALNKGTEQDQLIKHLIHENGITEAHALEEIDELIHDFFNKNITL